MKLDRITILVFVSVIALGLSIGYLIDHATTGQRRADDVRVYNITRVRMYIDSTVTPPIRCYSQDARTLSCVQLQKD
jgi:hypothetical protein